MKEPTNFTIRKIICIVMRIVLISMSEVQSNSCPPNHIEKTTPQNYNLTDM